MKKLLTIFVLLFSLTAFSQTHVTPFGEKCWPLKTLTDRLDSTYIIVVIHTGEPEDKVRIEQILKMGTEAEQRLIAEGYRVEIFKVNEIKRIPKLK